MSDLSSIPSNVRRSLRRDARAAFLLERITQMTPGERPTDAEREDIDRRLVQAVDKLLIDPSWNDRLLATYSPLVEGELARAREASDTTDAVKAEHRLALAVVWPAVHESWRLDNAERLAARSTLRREQAKGDSAAGDPDAERKLEESLREMLPLARDAVRIPPSTELPKLGDRDGLYTLDADFVQFVTTLPFRDARKIAEQFKASRQNLRTDGEEAWRDWQDPLVLPRTLARVLWRSLVKPAIEGKTARLPAVLAFPVAQELTAACWAPGRQLALFDDRAVLKSADDEDLAEIPIIDSADFEVMQRGVERLRSLTGQRVIRYLAKAVYELNLVNPGAADVVVEGGFSGFADLLGEKSKKAPEVVRDVLRAGHKFQRKWLNGNEVAGLWLMQNVAEYHGRRAQLIITVGPVLRPYYGLRHLPKDHRFGVPVLPLPPFCGRERDWASQAVFQFLLTAEMVVRRMELATEGGALLLPTDLEHIADRAGMPKGSWRAVIDRWLHDGSDGDAMLEQVAPNRYVIADRDPYKAAREWLLEGARRSLSGRQRGERRAAMRRTRA